MLFSDGLIHDLFPLTAINAATFAHEHQDHTIPATPETGFAGFVSNFCGTASIRGTRMPSFNLQFYTFQSGRSQSPLQSTAGRSQSPLQSTAGRWICMTVFAFYSIDSISPFYDSPPRRIAYIN